MLNCELCTRVLPVPCFSPPPAVRNECAVFFHMRWEVREFVYKIEGVRVFSRCDLGCGIGAWMRGKPWVLSLELITWILHLPIFGVDKGYDFEKEVRKEGSGYMQNERERGTFL